MAKHSLDNVDISDTTILCLSDSIKLYLLILFSFLSSTFLKL